MEVTKETPRVRWIALIGAWLIAAVLIWMHSVEFGRNRAMLDSAGLRGAAVAPTPMKHVVPTMYADTQMWVRNAVEVAEGAGPRIRYTHADNAPKGREVHWNSGFTWLIVGGGWISHVITGEPMPAAIESTLAWLNVPLLLAFIVGFSTWVARRAGAAAGVFLAFAMVGHDAFYSGFSPVYVDHHGILAAVVLGLILGALFMGVGFWRATEQADSFLPRSRADARRSAVFSAVCGGLGLWASAATLIPAIAIIGFSGVIAIALSGRRNDEVVCDPGVWRLWGSVGAGVSLFLYLLEYAPSNMGFRLEVNHPAFAAGWWGAGEIIAQFAEWRCGIDRAGRRQQVWLFAAVLAVLVAPFIVAIGGLKVFVVFDPFISRLSQYVAEGLSISHAVQFFGSGRFIGQFVWMGVALVAAIVALWRSRPADRTVTVFCVVAMLGFTGMSVAQLRWAPSAAGAQISMILLGLASLPVVRGRMVQWATIGVVAAALCVPFAFARYNLARTANKRNAVDTTDALQVVYRDVAATLRASQPEGTITMLGSPNASVAIGYYGRFQTIGTLYWENLEGTKVAAEMLSAQSDLEARRRVRERSVTHLAFISDENFLAQYFALLGRDPATASLERGFGYQVLMNMRVPLWLEQLPYELPPDAPYRPNRVLLLKTRFSSPEAESLYEAALADLAAGRVAQGEARLDEALSKAPDSAEFWVVKTNLLLRRNDLTGAAAAVSRAVAAASPAQKYTVCDGEATRFYQRGAHGIAVQLYRAAIAARAEPVSTNNLAWVLATSADDRVRNGREALALAEALVRQHKDVVFLNSYAAALAENGRFSDAAAVGLQAVQALPKDSDPKVVAIAEARLARYRAGQPWRE